MGQTATEMEDRVSIMNAYRKYANQGEKNRPIKRQNKKGRDVKI